jgi:signal recognition particle receptor subunit beta
MSFINYSSREINCKIVYYGPGLCGKTSNLQYVYNKTSPDAKGKMISLATETERTLFFDFLPLSLGEIRGFKTRFHLYTVPGQVFYDASRKLILKGVDGVVFVGDSQIERMEANLESVENLRTNLAEQGYVLDRIPYVVQYNKRDLPNAASVDELRRALNPRGVPDFEATATTGVGVFDTLKMVAKLVLQELRKGSEVGADIAMQFCATVHTADSTRGKHADAYLCRQCQRRRHRGCTKVPSLTDCHRQVTFGNFARWPEDALVFCVAQPHPCHTVEHCSNGGHCTRRAHGSQAACEGFTVGRRGQPEVGKDR